MPKLKTHRGAAKRLRKTGRGKIMRNKAFHSHLLAKKSAKRKRRLEGSTVIDPTLVRACKRMLPYL